MEPVKSKDDACSFCGKSKVVYLVVGRHASICDQCIELTAQVVAEARTRIPANKAPASD